MVPNRASGHFMIVKQASLLVCHPRLDAQYKYLKGNGVLFLPLFVATVSIVADMGLKKCSNYPYAEKG
jgi:hypothetical protein